MREIESIKDLSSILDNYGRVLALFHASWCPFCRSFLPVFEKNSGEGDSTNILKVKIDDETNPLWAEFSIEVVPTIILFNDGRVASRLDGTLGRGLTEEQLKNFLKSQMHVHVE